MPATGDVVLELVALFYGNVLQDRGHLCWPIMCGLCRTWRAIVYSGDA
ncbi:hypothetical protein [Sodalis-like endosymbiont of Proechinophthirus fluctus]|nr:hypothetical protein [Sodalis-like endosymbiont of Proechinophthirus fluctus]